MDTAQTEKLKALALAATPQDFDSAHLKMAGGCAECPACGGDGTVEIGNDYCNYDMAPIGVQFYGIGDEHVNAEAYYRAANPATVLELIAEVERLRTEAERYRWLRDKSEPGICAFYLSVGKAFHGVKFARETVDEAIDAAMAEEEDAT